MRLFLLAAALCARVLAQGAPQLQTVPSKIQVGQTYSLTWSGGENSPISLVLMAGPANSLSEIQKLAENVTGTKYDWKPSENLYDGNNYALLLSQKNSYTTSQQFVISGGLANPAASTTAASDPATPTLPPTIGDDKPQHGTNTTMILGVDKKGLGKDTAAGIIAGLIGIFAALFCLFVFSIATKKLAAMPPPGGKQPDTEAGMADAVEYKERKGSDADSFEMQSTSSRAASPTGSQKYGQKYSPALDSPETLVDTPKNRSNDPYMTLDSIPDEEPESPTVWHMEQPRTAYASSTAIPAPLAPAAAVTTLPAQTYQLPGNAKMSSHLQPAALMPQYTGETMAAASSAYSQSRVSRGYPGRLTPTEEDFQGRYQS